ncbi:MAG: N-acetylneuraminate synthase family protein [Rhodospirillales bacterium]|jgi:N-acetylneuraminate synthase/sialic acid synthase|nr:N-acetylneuraminate synthase family protein [Rhodospirillales bacterium]
MTREFRIGSHVITEESGHSFVIAEIGHNHQGDIDTCKALFKGAVDAGAHAVKLQKRDNRALFSDEMYDSIYNSENAYAPTYGAHRDFLEFDRDQYLELKAYAQELGTVLFATAFDFPSADFLEDIDMPAYKIASGDLTNTPLLKYIASFGKAIILSTGGGTMEDVRRAYETIMPINRNLCIMQCTSGYPPAHEELNLRVIETFRRAFPEVIVGFSSHDSGIAMPLIGYMLGARVFEKHFTLNRAWKGTDQAFSLEPAGLRRVVRDLERARVALGDGVKRCFDSEKAPLYKMAKAIVAARDLPAGTVLAMPDLTFKSPNDGVPPYMVGHFIGKVLTTSLKKDEKITFEKIGSTVPTD